MKNRFLILILLLSILIEGCNREAPDARLASPAPLIQELLQSGAPVFLTPEFFPSLQSLPTAQKALLPSPAESEFAARDKSLFWRLNREHHYGLVLTGASPAWRALTESLLNSPLWVLSEVSPWGYVFQSNTGKARPWQQPLPDETKQSWPKAEDRVRFLVLTASNLAAIGRNDEAEQLLKEAESVNKLPSLILGARASLAASRGHWEEAVSLSREALHSDSANTAAQKILMRALIETGHPDEALKQTDELTLKNSEDAETLFLIARAASAANAGEVEVAALSRLVQVGRKTHQPVGASLSYLGQAYAKDGNRGEALRSFQQALLEPELTGEQRTAIREIMDHLMTGQASSSTLPSLQEKQGGSNSVSP